MKTERVFLMNFLIILTICLLFGTAANAADPGQSFWSLNVGNFWTYSGNYTEEVKPKGTSPCSATQYKVEGIKNGLAWETNCLVTSLTDIKLCRLEFYYSGLGQFVKVTPSPPLYTCFTLFKNPITGTWTESFLVDVTIGPLPTIYSQTLTSTITVEDQQEEVTVSLGTFLAYKLNVVQSVTVPVYGTITKTQQAWFVPYLGIIKAEEGGDSYELISLKIKKEIADFYVDGKSDLAGLTSVGTIWSTTNLSTWTQIPGVLNQLVVGDFNGDGTSDLAGLTSNGAIYYTTNLSTWTQIPGVLNQLVVGDFNGDGSSDLAGLTSVGTIYYTTDLQTWTQIPGVLNQLVSGNFNSARTGDELAGLASNGSIWFTTNLSTWTQIPGVLDQLVVGDFNGNGSSDLAGLTSVGTIYYTANLSTWTQIPGVLDQLVVGDFNGNGSSDLAGLTAVGTIYYTTDLTTWTQIPGVLDQLVVGDFNGNGSSDLAGLASNGSIWFTTNLSTWTQIPGVLAELME